MSAFRRGVRLGVDVGTVRVGVAMCDPDGILATPVVTLRRDMNRTMTAFRLISPISRDSSTNTKRSRWSSVYLFPCLGGTDRRLLALDLMLIGWRRPSIPCRFAWQTRGCPQSSQVVGWPSGAYGEDANVR